MATRRSRRADAQRYQELLESTRDKDGVCHRDEAVKLLAEELADDAGRIAEFAADRASRVADDFDKGHQPEVDGGQMALDIDTYLVIGDAERVSVKDASAAHTRQWIDIQDTNHARVSAAWSAKTLHGRALLRIQDEQGCSFWDAEQIRRGERPNDAQK